MRDEQGNNFLFEDCIKWKDHWRGLPEYVCNDEKPFRDVNVCFRNQEAVDEFQKLVKQTISEKTKYLHFPKEKKKILNDRAWVSSSPRNPRYPLYIVSKGRWESRMTSKMLEQINVPYYIVIEKQEYKQYSSVINKKKILILDKKYQEDYDPCDDLGFTKSKGPGAARNFVWDHSISNGFKWHWVMDNNILFFQRYNRNYIYELGDGTMFWCIEEFVGRYENIAMAGPQYYMFIPKKDVLPPYVINTRIYSCNLIRNDVPYRWRGRYNEDTDLSLRMLKDGWCTVQFNTLLQDKMPTQTVKGGNTADFYAREGTMPKSAMLAEMHPDVSRVVWKFHRWHHYVDYNPFKKNKLIMKPKLIIPEGINEYGMVLQKKDRIGRPL